MTTSVSLVFGLLGNITTGLVYLSPLKTFWRIVKRRSTEEFESIPYVFKLLNAYFWTYYGIVKPDSVVVATVNGFGVVLEISFVVIFLLYAPPRMRVRTAILAVTCDIVFPATAILVTQLKFDRAVQIYVAGLLSAAFSMVAYASPLSAMKTVITTKSVEYMPFLLSFILFVNGGVWTVYAILTKDYFIGIPNGTGFGLGTAQLILYAAYYKPNKKPQVPPPTSRDDDDVEGDKQASQLHEPLVSY
ncbi:hypothetical protein MLD38_040568 [Melastoma candidum]|nr:hypothetical protein MLD38_040568 [Melastoma candidum]